MESVMLEIWASVMVVPPRSEGVAEAKRSAICWSFKLVLQIGRERQHEFAEGPGGGDAFQGRETIDGNAGRPEPFDLLLDTQEMVFQCGDFRVFTENIQPPALFPFEESTPRSRALRYS